MQAVDVRKHGGGSNLLKPVSAAETLASGTYTVRSCSGTLTGASNLTWVPTPNINKTVVFDTSSPNQIRMIVTRGPDTLYWSGASGSTWDTVTKNWELNGGREPFIASK